MRSIEFTESELLEMLSFYRQERDKALEKITQIERILSLPQPSKATPGTSPSPSALTERRNGKKADLSPANAPIDASVVLYPEKGSPAVREGKRRKAVTKPRGQSDVAANEEANLEENNLSTSGNATQLNGKWVRFIADLLEKQGRVIAADDIVSEAIYRYDIADEKHQTTRQIIYNTLYKLDSTKRMIGSCTIPGRKGKRYGLKKWFTPEGEIKESFLAKAI